MLKLNSPLKQSCTPSTDSAKIDPSASSIERIPVLRGFLRREELAHQLGLSPRTIDRWEALRIGPPRVAVGRTILYNIESVQQWLRSRENVRSK